MDTIRGARLLSLTVEAGQTYAISYESSFRVCILNHTDDVLYVHDTADIREDGCAKEALTVAANAFFNNLEIPNKILYITTLASGIVCLIR